MGNAHRLLTAADWRHWISPLPDIRSKLARLHGFEIPSARTQTPGKERKFCTDCNPQPWPLGGNEHIATSPCYTPSLHVSALSHSSGPSHTYMWPQPIRGVLPPTDNIHQHNKQNNISSDTTHNTCYDTIWLLSHLMRDRRGFTPKNSVTAVEYQKFL